MTKEELYLKLDNFIKNQLDEFESTGDITTSIFDILDVKNLSFETKVEFFRYILSNEDVLDSVIILNIFNMVKCYNAFDDSYFSAESTFFKDFEEYLDIKTELREELDKFSKQLCIYYMAVLYSCGVTDDTADRDIISMPLIYQRLLYIVDFVSMSNILNKTKNFTINVDELPLIQNSCIYLESLSNRFLIGLNLMKSLIDA